MAILNINSLQNPIDMSYIEQYMKDTAIQALANLGQRIGIKGDGIKNGEISFYDTLDNVNKTTYSSDYYMGVIEYDTDEISGDPIAKLGVTLKDGSLTANTIINATTDSNTFNKYLSTDTFSWDILINNIEEYQSSSVISIDEYSEYLYTMLYGKINGTLDSDDNNIELAFNKYSIEENRLVYALRAYNVYYTTAKSNCYVLLELTETSDEVYTLNVYKFNSGSLYDIDETGSVKENFEKLFNKSTFGESSMHISKYNFEDFCNNTTAYSDTEDNTTPFGLMISNAGIYDGPAYTYDLEYNTDKEVRLSCSNHAQDELILDSEKISLEEIITKFNNDITYSYPKYLEYYSNKQYNNSLQRLSRQVFFSIYEKLYNAEVEDSIDEVSYKRMYIPLDYTISTIQSDTDNLKMYFSNDIIIVQKNLSTYNSTALENYLDNQHNIIYDYDGIEKSKVYGFSFLYKSKYEDYITGIKINTLYSLPCLTSENTWEINGIDTEVYAIGKNAGNPNIILTYTGIDAAGNITNNILAGANDEILYGVNWKEAEYATSLNTTGRAFIPVLNSETSQYFEDALLINIDRSNENNTTSLWTLTTDEETNNVEFSYIKIENKDTAFDFNEIFNVSEIIKSTVFDGATDLLNSPVDKIIFKANDNSILNTFTDSDSNYITIGNKNADDYNLIVTTSQNYNNNLNLSVRYNTDIENSGTENIKGVQNDTRYLDDIYATNVIYPKYNKVATENTTSVVNSKIIPTYNDKTTVFSATAFTDGESIGKVSSISDITNASYNIPTGFEYKLSEDLIVNTTYTYEKSETEFYKEYVPNNNVPTADLSELLLRDVNVINRVNILSLNENGNIYNSYIGTTFTDDNKSILHIGSCSTNINIGTQTLSTYNNANTLNTQDILNIDIPTVNIDKLYTTNNYEVNNVNNNKYYSAKVKLIGEYGYEDIDNPITISIKKETEEEFENTFFLTNKDSFDKDKLFHTIYYDDSILDYETNLLEVKFSSDRVNISGNIGGNLTSSNYSDAVTINKALTSNKLIQYYDVFTGKYLPGEDKLTINNKVANNSSDIVEYTIEKTAINNNISSSTVINGNNIGNTVMSVYYDSNPLLRINILATVNSSNKKYYNIVNISKLFNDKFDINLDKYSATIIYNGIQVNTIILDNCINIVLAETDDISLNTINSIVIYPDLLDITYNIDDNKINIIIDNCKDTLYTKYNELYNR